MNETEKLLYLRRQQINIRKNKIQIIIVVNAKIIAQTVYLKEKSHCFQFISNRKIKQILITFQKGCNEKQNIRKCELVVWKFWNFSEIQEIYKIIVNSKFFLIIYLIYFCSEQSMARGGSRGSSRSPPPRSSTTATRPPPPPPQQTHTQVPPQPATQQSGGFLSGIGSTIMTGMAFGAGSEIAHQAVRGLMGGSSSNNQQQVAQQPQQNTQQYQNPCQMEIQNFSNCLQANDDVSYCQSYSDMLKQCKKSNNMV